MLIRQRCYRKAIKGLTENVATWYDLDPERDPAGVCSNGPPSARSLRTASYSHRPKPKEAIQKSQDTKEGLLRELPKNAPLKGRFGSLWNMGGEVPNLAGSGECKVCRP